MAIYKQEKSYTEEDLLLFIYKINSEKFELQKRIDKAKEFIDQELQYHLQPFDYKQVDKDINVLIGILQGK